MKHSKRWRDRISAAVELLNRLVGKPEIMQKIALSVREEEVRARVSINLHRFDFTALEEFIQSRIRGANNGQRTLPERTDHDRDRD
jgi:hypothetical protein